MMGTVKKKKKKARTPKQTLKRPQRLLRAKSWLAAYTGKHVVRAYKKKYHTDLLTSITELRMLGVTITPEYEEAVRATIAFLSEQKQQQKEAKEEELNALKVDQDENFAFIAGYTCGDAPYGIRWEEMDDFDLDRQA